MLITSKIINTPAGIQSHGFPVSIVIDCAPFKILPRLAVGGCTPIPKKLKATSSKIEIAKTEVE